MTNKQKIAISIGVLVALALIVFPNPVQNLGGVGMPNSYATSTVVTVTTATTTIVAYTAGCKEVVLTNFGGIDVYISAFPYVTSTTGIKLASSTAGGEMQKVWDSGGTLYCGPVYGVTAAGSATVGVHILK